MLKKISLPILLTVMCSLLLMVVLLYGFNTGKFTFLQKKTGNQTLVQTDEEVKVKRTDYTEVARKTLDWIDKQRNESGWYILEKNCAEKDCEIVWDDKKVGNKDGLIATWARLNFYEQYQDPKDLEIVKKDIDLFYDKYKDKDLNDSLWLCKVTYEMAQSKHIDQDQKEKLKELCFKLKEISTSDELEKYWTNHIYKEIKQLDWDYYSLYNRGFDSFFGQITDLSYKYAWSGQDKYIGMIEKYFSKEEKLISNNNIRDSQNFCLFGLSILDFWKLTDKSKTRLDYVINFYDTLKIKNEKDNFLMNPLCGLLAKRLWETTGQNSYLTDLESINKSLIQNNQRDEKGENGDGFVRLDLSKGGFQPNKVVVENALFLESLL